MYIFPFAVIPGGVTKAPILLPGYTAEQIPATKKHDGAQNKRITQTDLWY